MEEWEPQDEREMFHRMLCATKPIKKRARELTIARQVVFLVCFSQSGMQNQSCKITGTQRSTVHRWKKNDPAFLRAFKVASRIAVLTILDAAMLRVLHGVGKLIYCRGRAVSDPRTGKTYVEVTFPDVLTIFLLKKLLPERFGDKVGRVRPPATSRKTIVEFRDG